MTGQVIGKGIALAFPKIDTHGEVDFFIAVRHLRLLLFAVECHRTGFGARRPASIRLVRVTAEHGLPGSIRVDNVRYSERRADLGTGSLSRRDDPDTLECVACSARRQRTVSPITNTEYAGWRLSPSLTRDPVTVERKA